MAPGMSEQLYTRDILRLASAIPGHVHFRDLEGAVERRSPTCGSRMRMAVELDSEGRVQGLTQSVEACAFGQASAALMGAAAVGRSARDVRAALDGISSWLGGDDEAVESWPGLDVLAPARSRKGRHGAILLPFQLLLAAIEEQR